MNSIDRRSVLRAGLLAGALGTVSAAATACSAAPAPGSPGALPGGWTGPDSPLVAKAEAARYKTGRTVPAALRAVAGPVDLGGPVVHTWSYGGQVPGPEIRVNRGDQVHATLANHLPDPTTVHWHGIAVRNDMDGVPPLTQSPVPSGSGYSYRFTADDPGTYWYHPHVGTQLDRGLYGPLIIEDPAEPGGYDHDWTMVLDDWIDGTGHTPDQVMSEMAGMGGMASPTPSPSMDTAMSRGGIMLTGASSVLLGGDAGDVRYPYYLINGRVRTAPRSYTARPGQRVRIRFVNAGADTAFRVALGGHQMTVTHADGYPVSPVTAGAVLVGQGERYDVLVTLGDGVFPLVAMAEGKNSSALALIRTGSGTAPAATVMPAELGRVLHGYSALRPAHGTALPSRQPDITHRLVLTGNMKDYNWGINGKSLDMGAPGPLRFALRQGKRVRVIFDNQTMMYHPMHIHGHTFALDGPGTRKDTVIVLPGQQVACDIAADNPGQWVAHCHNLYHATDSGMMAVLGYRD